MLGIVQPKVILPRQFEEDIQNAFNECLRRGHLTEEPGTVLHYALTTDVKGKIRVAIWKTLKSTGDALGGVALVDPLDLITAVPLKVIRGGEED